MCPVPYCIILFCLAPDYFTLPKDRQFYSSRGECCPQCLKVNNISKYNIFIANIFLIFLGHVPLTKYTKLRYHKTKELPVVKIVKQGVNFM